MSVPSENLYETHCLGPKTGEWLVRPREVPSFHRTHTRVAGYSDARYGYKFVRIAPEFGQILACIAGEGQVLVDGEWRRCPAGFAYLTAPDATCAYYVPKGGRWKVCWIIYEQPQSLPNLERRQPPRLVCVDTLGLHLAIEGLCREAAAGAEPTLVEHWATLVHRHAVRILQPSDNDGRLSRLWAAVRQDLGGGWDLQRMARHAGMSPESLRRLCLRQVRRPPLAHVTHLRMQFAADLLSCSEEKIASIAERVGYGDEFAFSNAFKRAWGAPPSKYRARIGARSSSVRPVAAGG